MLNSESLDWQLLSIVILVAIVVSVIVSRLSLVFPSGTARNLGRRIQNEISPYHLPHIQINSRIIHSFQWLSPNSIRIHEHTIQNRQSALYDYLNSIETHIIVPCIIVDAESFMIIDGHHRFSVMQKLGWSRIPALLLNYYHPDIITHPLTPVSKSRVIGTGETQETLPPKSTQHMVKDVYGNWYPIACLSLMVQYDPTKHVDVALKRQLALDSRET